MNNKKMLFLTVYGPELESLFCYLRNHTQNGKGVSREQLYKAYFPHQSPASKGQTKNLDDALHYLEATGFLIFEGEDITVFDPQYQEGTIPFSALLLRQLRRLAGDTERLAPLDRLYVSLLEHLYVLPDRVWVQDVHTAANQLELAQQVGGISQEKVNAWKRVMEFLGIGYRVGGGFYCLYQPELVDWIARQWSQTEGTLQQFFEDHLQSWLPCLSARGEVAWPAAYALEQLASDGQIRLASLQDSPARPYFRARRLKGIQIL